MEQCLNIAHSIETLSCLDSVSEMYPFFYRPPDLSLHNQWGLSSPEKHYSQIKELHDKWRLSTVNSDYSLCPSYPPAVIVPKSTDDDLLKKVAKFRQGGRFPVLCYYHRKNGMVILRSSQPLTGANRKRCREDEHLLQAMIDGSDKGYIIDTRSSQQAQQARMTGGGFESKSSYSHWKRLHRQMERGKALQESLIKLVEACGDESHNMDRWLSKLENSKWLSHVQTALSTAGLLAECVERCGVSFPLALGFSEALLLRLANEVYASNYGTFLCNSHQERCALGVTENTHCLFQALLRPMERDYYSNPLYEPTELAIWPSVHPQSLQLWRGFFLRWTEHTRLLEEAQEEIRNMVIEWGKLALSDALSMNT
ncbi:Myotubularin-related protein 9 [Larimichthys crocea]|uniref:Uncharacterized protein n=1 Tax=Larimichthys crocea TaxID=215358 RepID=A0ACD3RQK4_LARCR|nr:Myotubularin-related protein 9 [Larimichthys crocea]